MANSVYLTVCDALSHIVSRRAAENIVRDALRVGRTNPDQVTPRQMQDLLKGQVFARLQQIIPVAQARGEIKTLLGQLEKMAKATPKALSPEVLEGLEALRAEFEPYEGLEHPRAHRIRSGIDSLPESPDPAKALNSLWAELDVLLNEVGQDDDLETITDAVPTRTTVTLPPAASAEPVELDDENDHEPFPLEMDDVMLELEADAAKAASAPMLADSPIEDVDIALEAAEPASDIANSNDEQSFLIPEFDSFGLVFEMEERPKPQPPTLELAPDALPDAQALEPIEQSEPEPVAATLEPAAVTVPEVQPEPIAIPVPVMAETVPAAPELVAVAANEPVHALHAANLGAPIRAEPPPPAFVESLLPPVSSAPSVEAKDEQDELRSAFDTEAGLEASKPIPEPVALEPQAAPAVAVSVPVLMPRRSHAKLNLTPEAQELLLSRFALEEGVIGVTLSSRMGEVMQARMREGSEDHLAGMAAATAMLLERRRNFDVFYTDLGEANVFIAPLGEALLTVLADRSVNVGRVLSEVKTVKEEL